MIKFDRPIEGWFNFNELYDEMVNLAPSSGAHFVELGVFKGCSAAHMANRIYTSGKQIRFDAIDWFKGSVEHETMPGVFPDEMKTETDRENWLYEHTRLNLLPAIEVGAVNLIKKSCKLAVYDYHDNTLDFVFHDASHEYDDLMEELPLWWKKIKPGGYFAGHDYSNWGFPGVARAVNLFAERQGRLFVTFRSGEDSWVIQKPIN